MLTSIHPLLELVGSSHCGFLIIREQNSGSLLIRTIRANSHQAAASFGDVVLSSNRVPNTESVIVIGSLTQTVDALAIADISATNQPLAMSYASVLEESQSPLLAHNQLYSNFVQSIKTGQEIQAAGIKQSMNMQFERLSVEMNKSKQLQERMIQMQKEMDEKQDHMLQMQQQALDRLAIIQSSVQVVLTQTYELHEYPIPRLFIVGLSGKLKNVFSEQFRLYDLDS